MSAQFGKGTKVMFTGEDLPHGLSRETEYEVVDTDGTDEVDCCIWVIDDDGDQMGYNASNFTKVAAEAEDKDDLYVEPEPLKNGAWTQAWVRVVDASAIGGEVTICMPRMEGDWRYLSGMVRISEDALIRTDDTPPWVKEEQPVTVTISGTRVFSEESGAPMVRLETGPGSYALIPIANISSITEDGAS